MARFLHYEEALAWAQGQASLTLEGMMRGLDASAAAAASFLRRMEADGLIGPAESDGTHPVLGSRRRRAASQPDREEAAAARLRAELQAALHRAERAEARLAALAAPRAQLGSLRRLLARELHPDAAAPTGDAALHAAYTAIFKTLWPRIETLLAGEPADRDSQPAEAEP
ncbi:hypothetical protein [Roseicella frigidaeris]|uniref:Uncharacterized protein n=1 Tax=Roseicella frigidaeris TaxID=2230885 RepID=A0A327M9B2_9PROT|nr:hypothetical protein [Roseicella frigidaeris]RAI59359.1 hypothetical protein DOO78_10055 [Roseicella frigidaeris]